MTTKQIEAQSTIDHAIGRILRLGARATQPGDVAEYDRCKAIILEARKDLVLCGGHRPGYTCALCCHTWGK